MQPSEHKWWTLLAVSIATFMLLLDVTVVNVALPEIQSDLGASFNQLRWVIDAYALTLAATMLIFGSLADRVGRRRVFTIGLQASPQASDEMLNRISPIVKTRRRPTRSASEPKISIVAARVSA